MIQTAAGVTVPFPEQLFEQYQVEGDTLTLNLSFDKLPEFVQAFYAMLPAPLFLAVHPDAENSELVYYLDGMTKKQLATILDGYGELLYQDGLSSFALASHESEEEIFIQKYKVISIYSPNLMRFIPLLERFGVERVERLTTAWDTFSEEHPGMAESLEIGGETIDDMIEALSQIGMYQA
ncbi:hypothetical protein [Butyricicoccus sp. Marseille-Q5471]|uniref:hypothetical protein n=1 Tax=Butyricicoccus sp. Marseille-Q5471 TaxID=3039493 RepID=UPI0024BC7EF5|nr:hypothetical protein [Butyricicoccus sp. Marseille-Q5471]